MISNTATQHRVNISNMVASYFGWPEGWVGDHRLWEDEDGALEFGFDIKAADLLEDVETCLDHELINDDSGAAPAIRALDELRAQLTNLEV